LLVSPLWRVLVVLLVWMVVVLPTWWRVMLSVLKTEKPMVPFVPMI
jgi:hypothetical protein